MAYPNEFYDASHTSWHMSLLIIDVEMWRYGGKARKSRPGKEKKDLTGTHTLTGIHPLS